MRAHLVNLLTLALLVVATSVVHPAVAAAWVILFSLLGFGRSASWLGGKLTARNPPLDQP